MVSQMNISGRRQQCLLWEGKRYTPEEIVGLADRGEQAFSPDVWDLLCFLKAWFNDSPYMTVHTSGSTGTPKELLVRKDRMVQSARLTCEFLGLRPGDTALLCMNLRYIGAMMMVVRSLVAGLDLVVRPASGHPLADSGFLFTSACPSLHFAAMVPLQVYHTLRSPEERKRLEHTDILIIGGGAIDDSLLAEIRRLPGAVYSTYGMTETLSHIALRRLNGDEASERYHPFASVHLSLSSDNTLIIDAPLICSEILYTNDIARLHADGSFRILGRKDNVINSGGIKIQAEEAERLLCPILPGRFVITSVPDERLGQAVVLLTEELSETEETLRKRMKAILPPYHCPKYVFLVEQIPQAGNGKTDRRMCRELARRLFGSKL